MLERDRVFTAECEEQASEFLAAKNLTLSSPAPWSKRGAFAAINAIYAPNLYLSCVGYGAAVEIHAEADRGDYGISVPLRGKMAVTADGGMMACSSRRTVLGSPGAPQRSCLGARSKRLALSLGRDAVRRRVAAMTGEPVETDVVFAPEIDLMAGAGRLVVDAMLLVATQQDCGLDVFADPMRVANFEETVLSALLLYHPHSHLDRFRRAAALPATRDVRRAIDFIEANLDQPLTLETIVFAAGVSGRTLNEHFRAVTGLSPMAYLRRARLCAIREVLVQGAAPSVTEAAMRLGFLHLGRFAGAYREAFGESPSETLHRARRRFSAEVG
jgi:AraC-like DNA-binding protein